MLRQHTDIAALHGLAVGGGVFAEQRQIFERRGIVHVQHQRNGKAGEFGVGRQHMAVRHHQIGVCQHPGQRRRIAGGVAVAAHTRWQRRGVAGGRERHGVFAGKGAGQFHRTNAGAGHRASNDIMVNEQQV